MIMFVCLFFFLTMSVGVTVNCKYNSKGNQITITMIRTKKNH